MVGRCALDQRVGDAGGERTEHRRASRPLVFQPLVALDATVSEVARLTFFGDYFDAVYAAVACVDQREIVSEAVGERDAVRRVRTASIDQRRYELFILS